MNPSTKTKDYILGQVVYAVLRQKAVVYPLQIVKETTEKTLDGMVTTYEVCAGKDRIVPLAKIDGEVFENAAAAEKALIDRAVASIKQKVTQAESKASEWFGAERSQGHDHPDDEGDILIQDGPKKYAHSTEAQELAAELQKESEEPALIELPGGQKARVRSVKLPENVK